MCMNNDCNKNPLDSFHPILISCEGDFVCNEHCKQEYEKQKNHFFNDVVHSEELTKNWLLGK